MSNSSTTPSLAARRFVAITGGKFVPSRRFRVRALLPYLREAGVRIDELCAAVSSYPPAGKLLRPVWFAAALAERLTYIPRVRQYDAVILQRELISTLATVERFLKGPRILDVDDAIYLHRGGKAASRIAAGCELVVCGNDYLAEAFSRWNSNVTIIPTGVDTNRLRPAEKADEEPVLRIGWIGTAPNFRYVAPLKPALEQVLQKHENARLTIVSSEFPTFLQDLGDRLEFTRWRPGIEETVIPGFSIGIMPLTDSEWARGKCAFKMLQYMAAGVPVVSSDVGVNGELLRQADIGIGATTPKKWVEALEHLLSDAGDRRRLGHNGRELAVARYSLPRIADAWRAQLERVR